jgi:hypothetical protein
VTGDNRLPVVVSLKEEPPSECWKLFWRRLLSLDSSDEGMADLSPQVRIGNDAGSDLRQG